jgi:hypothetical protein
MKKNNLKLKHRDLIFYLLLSAFCLIFAMIYEQYSHGVHSVYMRYMFLIPAVLGCVPALLCPLLHLPMPGRLWNDGVLILTLTSCLEGVFEIYGTSSPYVKYELYGGLILLFLDLALHCYQHSTLTMRKRIQELNH